MYKRIGVLKMWHLICELVSLEGEPNLAKSKRTEETKE